MVKITVIGYNQLTVLSSLSRKNIAIKSLRRIDAKKMSFFVREKDNDKTQKTLRRFNCEITVEKFGIVSKVKSGLKRFGCLIGIIIAMVPFIHFSGRILKVEVTGNVRTDDKIVLSTLGSVGIKVGSERNVDLEKAVDALVEMDEFIAASAKVSGCLLSVEVVESTVVEGKQEGDSVVSLYDCEITGVSVESGTALVKPGDRVPFGKTLIEGVEYSTAGEPLRAVKASGSVYGLVSFSYDTIKPIKYPRLKENKTSTLIYVFGKRIFGKQVSGEKVERTTSRLWSVFPLYAVRETSFVTEFVDVTADEAVAESVKEAITVLAVKHCSASYKVATNYTEKQGHICVNVQIQAEISVGGIR